MDTPVTVAIISACAVAFVAPAISYYLTKRKERDAEWQRFKFELYKEFVESAGGAAAVNPSPEDLARFTAACNTLHLAASKGALDALHDFQDDLMSRGGQRQHELLSRLAWELRKDLRIARNPSVEQFKMKIWTPGRR